VVEAGENPVSVAQAAVQPERRNGVLRGLARRSVLEPQPELLDDPPDLDVPGVDELAPVL